MREEVWAIVRAAVEEATGPLLARQRELEGRLERAERGATAAAQLSAALNATPPPLPPPVVRMSPAVPSYDQAPGSVTNPGGYQGSTQHAAQPLGPRASIPPTGYGVSVMNSVRPTLDLESVGPVDIDGFDGGRAKRRVTIVVVVVMVILIASVIAMSVLSHN